MGALTPGGVTEAAAKGESIGGVSEGEVPVTCVKPLGESAAAGVVENGAGGDKLRERTRPRLCTPAALSAGDPAGRGLGTWPWGLGPCPLLSTLLRAALWRPRGLLSSGGALAARALPRLCTATGRRGGKPAPALALVAGTATPALGTLSPD